MKRALAALLLAAAPAFAIYPQIRGSSIITSSAGTVPVAFPTGTIAGDLAIIFVAGGNNFFNPVGGDGWTATQGLTGSFIAGSGYFKILDAGDIATGSYTINPNGANPGVYAIVTIQKTTFSPTSPIRETLGSRHNPGLTSETLTTSGAVVATDLVLSFGAVKSGTTTSISPNTASLGSASAGGTAGGFAYYEVPTPGALTTTFSYGAGSGDYQIVVVVELGGGASGSGTFSILY